MKFNHNFVSVYWRFLDTMTNLKSMFKRTYYEIKRAGSRFFSCPHHSNWFPFSIRLQLNEIILGATILLFAILAEESLPTFHQTPHR